MNSWSTERQQAFQAAYSEVKKERRSVGAELVKDVMPTAPHKAIPKKKVIAAAVERYESTIGLDKQNDPFLVDHSDRFINPKTLESWWAQIKKVLASEGVYIAWNQQGVFLTNDPKLIRQSFEAEEVIIRKSVGCHNERAELTNKGNDMQLPLLAVQLLLPGSTFQD